MVKVYVLMGEEHDVDCNIEWIICAYKNLQDALERMRALNEVIENLWKEMEEHLKKFEKYTEQYYLEKTKWAPRFHAIDRHLYDHSSPDNCPSYSVVEVELIG